MELSWETRLFSVSLRQRADEILEKVSPQKSADVSRRQREDTITIRADSGAHLALLSPSTQPLFSIFPNRFSHISSAERREEQKKQKRKLLAGEIAITVPEAENGGRQEVQHDEYEVASG